MTRRRKEENPRITLDDDGGLDDLLARDVSMVHFEATDTCEWYGTFQLRDGTVWQVFFGAKNSKAKGVTRVECLGVYPEQGKLVD